MGQIEYNRMLISVYSDGRYNIQMIHNTKKSHIMCKITIYQKSVDNSHTQKLRYQICQKQSKHAKEINKLVNKIISYFLKHDFSKKSPSKSLDKMRSVLK